MSTAFNVDPELLDQIDQIVLLDKEIKAIKAEKLDKMEEKRGLLVKKLERQMTESNMKEVDSTLGKCMWVSQNRKKLDEDSLFTKFGVSASDVTEFTKINVVSYLKITPNK